MKKPSTIESYPVCPYFSCKNGKLKTDNLSDRIIKCACSSSNTNSIMIGFKSGEQKKLHMTEFCRNIKRFSFCPIFETIYCIESCGKTTFLNSDKKSEIKDIYKESK